MAGVRKRSRVAKISERQVDVIRLTHCIPFHTLVKDLVGSAIEDSIGPQIREVLTQVEKLKKEIEELKVKISKVE